MTHMIENVRAEFHQGTHKLRFRGPHYDFGAPEPLPTRAHVRHCRSMLRWGKGWEPGRQHSGYDKRLLVEGPNFDAYLLRFGVGAQIPSHRDPVDGARHYRLNLILVPARRGGEFVCEGALLNWRRLKLFRSDQCAHAVTRVEAGTRYVLSLGLAL